MKKFLGFLIILLSLTLFIENVSANSISSINMDIYVDNNGDAHITETWAANLSEGTEGYRYYGNLGNSEIVDYSVKDEDNVYTNLSSWNTSASFSEKAYKYGIYDAGDHKELCFGISEYGTHTYTLKYTIKGFVATNSDSDMIYWELIPSALTSLTDNVYIKIHSDFDYADTLDVWGYGNYGGYAYVYDGYIEMSNASLSNGEYMTILVKFAKNTFTTSNEISNDFTYYYDMAEVGTEHYVEENKSSNFSIIGVITTIFNFVIWVVIIGAILKGVGNSNLNCGSKRLDFGVTGKKVPKEINLFRELPCDKDLYRAYWLAYNYGLMKKQTDFLGVILLKWLKQDKIKIESKTVGSLFKKEETTIVFSDKTSTLDNELESNLYSYMYEASKDGILESREFEKWCKTNYSKILKWFDQILDLENDILISENKLIKTEKVSMKVFKSTVYEVNSSMMEEAIKMKGLKLFFDEFENMKDKTVIEVKLWEEYLMYAQIFGVAEKVAKQFKEMYPDIITDQTYSSMVFVHTMAYTGMVSASSAKTRAESYSSGGGGFSSGGGGGGSFGGGGGGGFR